MNFINQKNKLLEREKALANLKTMDQAAINQMIATLKKEHQALAYQEASEKNNDRQKNWHQLLKQNENQMSLLNQYAAVQYQRLVKSTAPKVPVLANTLRAFAVGGGICVLGQLVINYWILQGIEAKTATGFASVTIVVLTGLLTGLGIYDEIGRFGGAGSMVPISGFANSVVSAALEFKREGMVYGIGAKIFTVAGPVILYGVLASVVIGLIKFIMM